MDRITTRLFFIVSLLSLSFTATAQEVEDESNFRYDLDNNIGPNHWGNLNPNWFMCNNGTMQSPIDLMNNKVQVISQLGELTTLYRPTHVKLVNRGHDIEVRFEGDAGYIKINGTRYFLYQCHWHSPSEHAIDGVRFDLGMHCVHQSRNGGNAVIEILYKIGAAPDPFLAMFTNELIALANGAKESSAGIVDPRVIQATVTQYYRYIGSLTTPPCSEDVVWTVVKTIRNVSGAQVQLLRDAVRDGFEDNARPLKPLNNRVVQLYRPLGN